MTPARRALAFHEAGHAIAAFSFNLPVLHVTIIDDGERAGRCWYWIPTETPPIVRAAIALAGPLAALKAAGYDGFESWCEDVVSPMHHKDIKKALECAHRDEGEFIRATQLASDVLNEKWAEVENLAEALLIRGELSEADLCLRFLTAPSAGTGRPLLFHTVTD